jgi:hypothetical protein
VRTTLRIVSALAVVVAAACSPNGQSPGSGADLNRADALRGELASSRLTSANAIVADFEVPPTPATAEIPSGSAATAPAPSAPAVSETQTASAAVEAPSFALVEAVVELAVRPAPFALPAPSSPSIEAPPSAPMGGDDTGVVNHVGDGTVLAASPGSAGKSRGGSPTATTGIVIRGGPTSAGLDPCATHVQVTPAKGHTMVNNRIPTTVGGVRLPR